MSLDLEAKEILRLVNEMKSEETSQYKFLSDVQTAESNNNYLALNKLLGYKKKEEIQKEWKKRIFNLLDEIDKANERLLSYVNEAPPTPLRKEKPIITPEKRMQVSKAEQKKLLLQVNAAPETIKRIREGTTTIKPSEIEYTVYKTPLYGKIANTFFKPLANSIVKNNKTFFRNLYNTLRASDMKILTQTYISMIFFSTLMIFFLALLGSLFLFYFLHVPLFFCIFLAIFVAIVTFALLYLYPALVVNKRKRMIKNDLPFAIIHMAAVAGSGAQPIAIFKLLLSSSEYPGLESEIKKIVNYVNLFGYDLSTALKTVASTTPSQKFKDLLNGIVATIESGGSLKSYLSDVAKDTMATYRLDRKRYVESLATYSDIYTGILIAAPLLFIVTLAIINIIGGNIGGTDVGSIAIFGTYLVIPLMNMFFIVFLNIVQPEA